MKLNRILITALFLIMLLPLSSFSAVDMFIKIADIEGESKVPGHEGEIDVLSWSWGMTVPLSRATGRATGKRQHKPFTVTKSIDKASPLLYKACATGKVIPSAKFVIYKTNSDGSSEPYFEYVLTDVIVDSYSVGGSSDDKNTEQITLSYRKIKWTYLDGAVEHEDSWEAPR